MGQEYRKIDLKLDNVTSLSDVFRLFRQSIYKDLHVSSLAIFKRVIKNYDSSVGYGVIEVTPVPTTTERGNYTINAYFIDDLTFTDNQLLQIIFTDLNFVTNLNNDKTKQFAYNAGVRHSEMNAVVISGGGNSHIDVDTEMSDTSTNAVENKVIKKYVDDSIADIPTPNNGTLTLQKNGTQVAQFSANQSGNVTANFSVPTKTSDLQNDSGFITNTVNNLTNYYLKNQVYNKTEIDNLLSHFTSFQVVQTLPVTGQSNIIYLVPKQGSQGDYFNEYIWVNNQWELIGNTQIDLTNYVQYDDTIEGPLGLPISDSVRLAGVLEVFEDNNKVFDSTATDIDTIYGAYGISIYDVDNNKWINLKFPYDFKAGTYDLVAKKHESFIQFSPDGNSDHINPLNDTFNLQNNPNNITVMIGFQKAKKVTGYAGKCTGTQLWSNRKGCYYIYDSNNNLITINSETTFGDMLEGIFGTQNFTLILSETLPSRRIFPYENLMGKVVYKYSTTFTDDPNSRIEIDTQGNFSISQVFPDSYLIETVLDDRLSLWLSNFRTIADWDDSEIQDKKFYKTSKFMIKFVNNFDDSNGNRWMGDLGNMFLECVITFEYICTSATTVDINSYMIFYQRAYGK